MSNHDEHDTPIVHRAPPGPTGGTLDAMKPSSLAA
jgi:hypothetical protein